MFNRSIAEELEKLEFSQQRLERELSQNKAKLSQLAELVHSQKSYSPFDQVQTDFTTDVLPQTEPKQENTSPSNPDIVKLDEAFSVDLTSSNSKSTPPPLPVEELKEPAKVKQESIKSPMPALKSGHEIENHFGRVWLVRLGIITLLTGLIFLSNYAYTNFIYELPAWPRVIGLYITSAFFLGIGHLLQVKKEALKNYGSVLAAGGLAIFYYTSYAAHYVERLKIIESPALAGIILTITALICLQYALSKKSSVIAVFSLALAFYTTSINPAGAFTVISSSILTMVGLFIFYKLKHLSVGFTTLIGAYASYAYWQIIVNQGEGFIHANYLLIPYWLLFTAAIFLCKSLSKNGISITYASINNTLFFLLFNCSFDETMLNLSPSWQFTTVLGAALIGISFLVKLTKREEKDLTFLYLAKGLALLTYASFLIFEGESLTISLAIQSTFLFALFLKRSNPVLGVSAAAVLGLSLCTLVMSFSQNPFLYALLTLSCFTNTYLLCKTKISLDTFPKEIRQIPAILAVILSAIGVSQIQGLGDQISILMLGLTFIYSLTLLSKKLMSFYSTVPYTAHLLTAVAIVHWMSDRSFVQPASFYFVCGLLFAGIFAIYFALRKTNKLYIHSPYLCLAHLSFIIFSYYAFEISITTYILALVPLLYHLLFQKLKCRTFVVIGLLSYPLCWLTCFLDYRISNPDHLKILFCIATPLVHYALQRGKILKPIPYTSGFLIVGSTLLSAVWLDSVTPYASVLIAGLGLIYILAEEKGRYSTLTYTGISLISLQYIYELFEPQSPQSSLLIVAMVIVMYIKFRQNKKEQLQEVFQIASAVFASVTLMLSTTSKESVFRIAGFIILGICLTNVYFVDVWKLHALIRILSFLTLGGVLILAGFLYCRKKPQSETIQNNSV